MQKGRTEHGFDYYFVELPMTTQMFYYYFKAESRTERVFFDRCGVSDEIRNDYSFLVLPGFSTPDWSKGAVIYQIFVDRFYNGDKTNDVLTNEYFYLGIPSRKIEDWDRCPSDFSVAEFYGGDLEGVRQKLDYLKDLGVEVIYFNPLFVSPSNHKYDTQDYDYIDPHYGKIVKDSGSLLPEGVTDNTLAKRYINRVTCRENLEASNLFFAELVEEIHSRGMKVILDGVFNHCGSFHKWMDREGIYGTTGTESPGAFLSEQSSYRDFFYFLETEDKSAPFAYEGWWGNETLPKLHYENSKELYHEILRIATKWVSPPFNADGWRLDVAADLGHSAKINHQFWQDFRKAVKKANPNAVILAEHYGDPRDWLSKGDQWDTVMNYDAFMEPLTWFLTGMDKHSDMAMPDRKGDIRLFEESMCRCMANLQTSQLLSAMNELSNHDHSRFLTRTNGMAGRAATLGTKAASEGISKAILREAVVVQMTWPGSPTIYYGDEAGVCGFTDPDNRRTYPWGREDTALIDFHRDIIRIHRGHQALRTGSLIFLHGEQDILCYARFNRDEQFVVIINNDCVERELNLYVWPAGIPKEAVLQQLLVTSETEYSLTPKLYTVTDGYLPIKIQAHSAILLGNSSDRSVQQMHKL